jgi:hypothetical protein
VLAKPKLDLVTIAVDGAVQIPPPPTDLDISLLDMLRFGDGSLAGIEALQQERSIVDGPAIDSGMIHDHASFGHHPSKIAQAEAIGQVPPDAEQDDRAIKMPALEQTTLRRTAFRKKRLPASASRLGESRKSMVCPVASTARYRYTRSPFTRM